MSFAALAIIELSARLRLACQALSAVTGQDISPADVDLAGCDPAVAAQLRADGTTDFWLLLAADHPDERGSIHGESETESDQDHRARSQDHRAGRRGLAG